MNPSLWGWGGLVVILCVSTFGVWWCLALFASLITVFLGGITCLYVKHGESAQKLYSNLFKSRQKPLKPGLNKVVQLMEEPKGNLKADRRLTGSHLIDECLQEVMSYVIRDYVAPWYYRLSSDQEFPHQVQLTTQKVIVTFACRVKEVNWIPYLTTRLVDDAASHLRLYRSARNKLKQCAQGKSGEGTPVCSSPSDRSRERAKDAADPTTRKVDRSNSHPPRLDISGDNLSTALTAAGPGPASKLASIDLESMFFDLEVTMEDSVLCRDLVSTEKDSERQYLQDLSEVLLFLLLPAEDFHCKPLRFLLRELIVSAVVLPLFDLFSDPDYINQIIIWLCREIPLTSDVFLTALRVTDNKDELYATRDIVVREIAQLRSRDSGGDDDASIKQQLSSLIYVRKVIDSRIQRLKEGGDSDSAGLPSHIDWNRLLAPGTKLFSLPLDVVLKNNIALAYFIDYMTSIAAQAYLFFYLNVEGWRVSAEQQISDHELQKLKGSSEGKKALPPGTIDNMKEAAYSIFEQYLSEKASPRLKLDETLIKKLLFRIRSETPNESWFDEVQAAVYEKLQNEEKFLPGFRNSIAYVKLLAELDLLKEPSSSRSDEEDSQSLDEMSLSDNVSLASFDSDVAPGEPGSLQLSTDGQPSIMLTANTPVSSVVPSPTASVLPPVPTEQLDPSKKQGPFTLYAEIIETGIVHDRGKTYGIYAIAVAKKYDTGYIDKWHVYRRYSDFHDLHQKIKEKYSDLAKLTFPGKKTFHNMERTVLEKRMKMLNDYLQILVQPGVLETHPHLQNLLLAFVEHGDYDKGVNITNISKTFDTLVNPLKSSMRTVGQAVRTMPDNLLSTVDGVMDGISKVFQAKTIRPQIFESTKVGASIHEEDENIPLRIMLLLMDEVFDLKSRNQWLRRRIVTLLRQIIRTMFGDIVNRRILDYVAWVTSPEQVAEYLKAFKHSFWPNGVKAEPRLQRDEATRMRTRVAAKVALLSSLSDELKHILGSETTRRGLLCVFELFQRPVLNRRLLYVLLEGILETLFPQHRLPSVFRKLHSRSPRVRDDFKTSRRSRQDLRR